MTGTRSPLGRALGLGAAGTGTAHWWAQRITAVALVPLSLWFVISVLAMIGTDYMTVRAWIHTPWVALLLVLFLGTLFHHSQLGLQVVVEDYVHAEWLKLWTVLVIRFATVVVALASIFAVLRIAFGG